MIVLKQNSIPKKGRGLPEPIPIHKYEQPKVAVVCAICRFVFILKFKFNSIFSFTSTQRHMERQQIVLEDDTRTFLCMKCKPARNVCETCEALETDPHEEGNFHYPLIFSSSQLVCRPRLCC